ncbi:4Fe-4S single cluster domain-containing protein [Schwartzia succinivorans]|uniref:Anaerobic ribonucleoside-triphosphate reductase-activating protein n=1 Tax=Schwartzia succinivorans DSM 10502 TaxID=1123243 RepID=A0A1M4XD99_9FIRM|nr:4Fe-4S single cluster domain-containing protein [Schwartzia succinivorans]SHE91549.1 anaerobic ribonucleoside-triphosphate reductase activating protein [Schwartzia succinivorans DSM 10502]
MAYLNLAAIRTCTEAEGPGKRFAIWSQGCLRRCPGCCNPHMQPMERKHLVKVDKLMELILKSKAEEDIEGVSFIGGEPVLQAEGFAELAQYCQKVGLSVLLFTGYYYEDLLAMEDDDIDRLLRNTDILVDGEFIESLRDQERDWVGSENQHVIFLSDRYNAGIEFEHGVHNTEIRISDGGVGINGWPLEI